MCTILSLYVTLPLLTVLALLQDTTLAQVTVLGAHPDVVLLAVVVWAFLRGSAEGTVWAFVGGLILDLLSGGPMGGMTLALLATAFFVGRRWGQELGSTTFQLVLLTLVAGFAYHLVNLLVLGWVGHPVNWSHGLSRVAGPSAVLNAALAPFIYRPLAWLDRRTRTEGFTLDEWR